MSLVVKRYKNNLTHNAGKMKNVEGIILHCTASPEGTEYSLESIENDHHDRGFCTIGYHYVIKLDGDTWQTRDLTWSGGHTEGYNSTTIGISYVGGILNDKKKTPKDTRTLQQKNSMYQLVASLLKQFNLNINNVHCHREYNKNKACPCFEREQFYQEYKSWISTNPDYSITVVDGDSVSSSLYSGNTSSGTMMGGSACFTQQTGCTFRPDSIQNREKNTVYVSEGKEVTTEKVMTLKSKREKEFEKIQQNLLDTTPNVGRDIVKCKTLRDSSILKGTQFASFERTETSLRLDKEAQEKTKKESKSKKSEPQVT